MSQVQKGVVQRVSVNKDRNGKKMYGIKLDDSWYNTKWTPPGCNEGDTVEFAWEEDRFGKQVDMDTLKVVAEATADSVTPKQAATKDDYWRRKEDYDKIKDKKYERRAARAMALDVIKLSLEHGALELPKTKGKGVEAIMAYTKEIQDRFYQEDQDFVSPNNGEES